MTNPSSQSRIVTWVGRWHQSLVFGRRVRVLAGLLAAEIPVNCSVLDIGCGDGSISSVIQSIVPGVEMHGMETMERSSCRIPCKVFDGVHIPFPDGSFDICMFVDVLHHTYRVDELFAEACRVSRRLILIKDHRCEGAWDYRTLQLMDWVGNRSHGVTLPYNYQSETQWQLLFKTSGLKVRSWKVDLRLYPGPVNALFGRKLHFVALLEKLA